MKAWYLIHSKPRQEEIAKQQLQRQGYETYLPLAPVRRRRRGRSYRVIAAMFPRYLFIHLSDKTDDWRPIRSTVGVANLVRFDQWPARVPDSLIAALRQREDNEGIQILPGTEFKQGDRVRIAEGPFEGYEAIFQARSSKDRVLILLKLAEKHINLKLDESLIESLK
ncbi:MAG: transcription/translation regulatory transformer protein RfaH [Gammaproteobacteria bacterium]